jgi:hypothetical protein
MVRVFQTFANERQLKNLVLGEFEVESAVDYTPKLGDSDYIKGSDVPWIKRFAAAGGKVIISGNTEMKNVQHERLALVQAGMIVFFFDGKWSQWKFFRKCSLLIHWWPEMAKKLKRAKPATFFHVPLNWSERSKIRKVSTDDPQKLKIEKQIKAGDRIRRIRKKAMDARSRQPVQTSFLDLLSAGKRKGGKTKPG